MTATRLSADMSFAARLEARHRVDPATGCWEWTGACFAAGYGRIDWALCDEVLVHRLAYRLFVGDPGDLCVCHSCDNPICFNPDHLWLGTQAENNADKAAKGRASRMPGERNPGARLTATQVVAIRKDPRTQREIAEAYGCSQPAVNLIKVRRTWGHLEEVSA